VEKGDLLLGPGGNIQLLEYKEQRFKKNQKNISDEIIILHIWVFPKIRKHPKWMVKIMENRIF